ncbi:MAG: LPS assembly lipoprotein LptE [Pseudomonadota bacterium]
MRLVWLGLLSIALSACGFHLRGQFTLPPLLQPVAVVSTVPTLEDRVSAGIQRMGGIVSADAPMQVHITRETVTRQTSTVDRLAKAAEYTLFYELNFQLKYASGIPAQPERSIRLRRTYQFDNTRIVGKFDEEETLKEDMRQQAVAQLLTQLSRTQASELSADAATPAAPAQAQPAKP